MDDHSRAFAENPLKNFDYSIEFTREVLFSDPFVFENPVDLIPDSSPEQTLECGAEAIAQDFVEYE
jgi:hypothetical protein